MVTLVKVVFPIFLTSMLYVIISPASTSPSPLSVIFDVFVTSKPISSELVLTIVRSFVVFPSVSSPSSLTSLTSLVFPGLLPVTVTVLTIEPLEAAYDDIV